MEAMAASKTTYACWSACGLLALRTFVVSAVTVLPKIEAKRDASAIISGLWSFIFAFLAIYSHTRSRDHWIHRSKKASASLIAIALLISVGAMLISFY